MPFIGRGLGADAAYARFLAAVPHYQQSRFWAQRYDWIQGTPLGDDVLADALHYLYGFLFSAFNIRSTLSEVAILGPPAKALWRVPAGRLRTWARTSRSP